MLQPLESMTFTFDAIDYDSDDLMGNIYLGNVFEQDTDDEWRKWRV